jgi:anti-anti-sigma factor
MTTTALQVRPTAADDDPAGTIAVEQENGLPVLRLTGEIDEEAVAAYDRAHAVSGTAPAVIDTAAVTFLDCRGLRFLLRQGEAARRAGRTPALRRPPRVVCRVLGATGTEDRFTITA